MTTATVQLPVLFDVSGTATVFGESATTADFISPHLEFTLDMTTEANDISLNAAHIRNAIAVGDHEISDTIYYAQDKIGGSIDVLCNRLAKAITRGKLVHVPTGTDHSDGGIPMGGRPLVQADGTVSATAGDNIYALKYRTSIAPVNDEQMMGEAMARVAAVHLVGHPLAQAVFKNESTIQDDLEVAASSTFSLNGYDTNFYNTFATQLSKVLGGALASTPLLNAVLDPSGQVGEAIFEGASDSGSITAPTGTTTHVVTVVNSGGNKFAIGGVTQKTLTLVRGSTYIFDQAEGTNNGHRLKISTDQASPPTDYPTGITLSTETPGTAGAKTTFVVPYNAPGTLYYYCDPHGAGMGGVINVVSAQAQSTGTSQLLDVSGEIAGVAVTSLGEVKLLPDVSGNSGSTRGLYGGDKLDDHAKPTYIHDLEAQSFGGQSVRSMTFWLKHSNVDASLNSVTNAEGTIFHAITNANSGAGDVKLKTRDVTNQNDRLVVLDDQASAQITAIKINGTARTHTHAQGAAASLNAAVTEAEIKGAWNHFYVEFASGSEPRVISWLAERANARTKPLLGSYLDEVHYFNKALTDSEISAMKLFRTSTLKANGKDLPAVKSMFEQLMNIPGRALDMDSAIEVTGLGTEGARTSTVGMPIKTGDKIVVFIRPKVEFAFESVDVTSENILGFTGSQLDVSNGVVTDISGLVTAGASASTISSVFPGRAAAGQSAEANTYGWMGSPNATMIGLESTNITAVNTMDQHIWKITITL
jgi:plastocyanin